MRRPRGRLAAAAVAALLVLAISAAPTGADVINREAVPVDKVEFTLPFSGWGVGGFNDSGELFATSNPPDVAYARRADGTLISLNRLAGDTFNAAFPTDLTQSGLIVGTGIADSPFLYDLEADELTVLDTSTRAHGGATSISERGNIVGWIGDSAYEPAAWVGPDHHLVPLQTPPGVHGYVEDVNDEGVAVGWFDDATGTHAATWDLSTGALRVLDDLGSWNSQATEINNAGQIVGGLITKIGGEVVQGGALWRSPTSAPEIGDYLASRGGRTLNEHGQILLMNAFARPNHNTLSRLDLATGMVVVVSDDVSSVGSLNERGQVGYITGDPNTVYHAYMWDEHAGTADLGDLPIQPGGPPILNERNQAAFSSWYQQWIATVYFGPQPPQVPMAHAESSSAIVEWQQPTYAGDAPVSGYRIYRDGQLVGNTSGAQTFTDSAVPAGATVVYTVTAVSAYGESKPAAAPALAIAEEPADAAEPVMAEPRFTG